MPNKRSSTGFTLIEMMIAIGLGIVVCVTAFACARICSQAVTACNKLSLENTMMRVGFSAALDDLDFWTSYDDPDDASKQELRAKGHPFYYSASDVEGNFSGEFTANFDQSKPANWWRGLGPCNDLEGVRGLGIGWDYGLASVFSKIDHSNPDARKLPIFLRRLPKANGYAAMFDMAPANMIYTYYDENWRTPDEFTRYRCAPGFISRFDRLPVPMDISMTNGSLYAITKDPRYINDGVSRHRFNAYNWGPPDNLAVWDPKWDVKSIVDPTVGYNTIQDMIPTMASRPENWPQLDIQVRHFVAHAREFHTASISVAHPVTGERYKFFINTTSTTLRGARRQRGFEP
jgi:hypothetical protein